ncbi:MAG: restriction endonuclease [Solirubrobacterales bacterium]
MMKPAWKRYEEHILERVTEWAGENATIEFDVKLPGKLSKRTRQIDILVTGVFADGLQAGLTAAIDCKCYGKNINVGHVDKFVGLIEDVQTDFGILITNKGWSQAAEERLPRGLRLRLVEDEPVMAMALIDLLPEPTYHIEWGEDHYTGEFWDNEPFGGTGACISYNYVERESRRPIDHPDQLEWLDEPLASNTIDELNWSDDAEREAAARIVLDHYLGQAASEEELEVFVLEVASKWEDGQEWSVEVGEIERQTGLWPNIKAG